MAGTGAGERRGEGRVGRVAGGEGGGRTYGEIGRRREERGPGEFQKTSRAGRFSHSTFSAGERPTVTYRSLAPWPSSLRPRSSVPRLPLPPSSRLLPAPRPAMANRGGLPCLRTCTRDHTVHTDTQPYLPPPSYYASTSSQSRLLIRGMRQKTDYCSMHPHIYAPLNGIWSPASFKRLVVAAIGFRRTLWG